MKVLIITDLEGCAGIFHREIQISRPVPQEYARTLRICTREVVAAIEGALAAGAREILIDALHDIDLELLPAGVQIVRGKMWWDDRYLSSGDWDALLLVGMHGGAHLQDCALAHTFLPSWQIETTDVAPEGWAKQVAPHLAQAKVGEFSTVKEVLLNGTPVGEASVILAMAAAHGLRTACLTGDSHACQEIAVWVPQIELVPVKWGIAFRAARMLSPSEAQDTIRRGVERALRRLPGIPIWTAANRPMTLQVRYVHEARAERAAHGPGARREDSRTVAVTVPHGAALSEARFLFARPQNENDPPTAEER